MDLRLLCLLEGCQLRWRIEGVWRGISRGDGLGKSPREVVSDGTGDGERSRRLRGGTETSRGL